MSTATSGSVKVTVPALTGTGNYQFWSLCLHGILGTTTHHNTSVTAWDLTGKPKDDLPALPTVCAVHAGTENVSAITQTMHDNDVLQCCKETLACDNLKNVAISIIIAGLSDSMLHLADGNDPCSIWQEIKNIYSTAGPAEVYHSLMHALNWHIPGDKEPSLSISELEAVFSNLDSQGVDIPEVLEAMILLQVAPGNTDSLAQLILANHQKLDDLTWDCSWMSNGCWQPSVPSHSNKRFQSGPQNNNRGNKPAFGNQQRMQPQSQNDQSHCPQQEDHQKQCGTRGGCGRGKGHANVAKDEYTTDTTMEFAPVVQRPEVSPLSLLHCITPGGELPVKSVDYRILIKPMHLSAAKKCTIAAWDDQMGNALVNSKFAPIGCITKDKSIDVEQSFVEPENVENLWVTKKHLLHKHEDDVENEDWPTLASSFKDYEPAPM
ncbi:hypothetical protein NP233_g8699 [Leucocoprinus birnbaumii]|uniref:Uncharacterized protein n=1 Tax=Leucocoprinus birnbaumii TaxID=56174 RepID=A0AAD5VQF5_9AGAR|nr:hypothetical protein NP233_g8699 [Leucocoprinus birnbaumii]